MKNGLTHMPTLGWTSRTRAEVPEPTMEMKARALLENFDPLSLVIFGIFILVIYFIYTKSPTSINNGQDEVIPKELKKNINTVNTKPQANSSKN